MNDLDPAQLTNVVGGASQNKSADVTAQLTALQDSIKSISSSKNGCGNNNQMFMMMAMMFAMRPQGTTVVAGGGCGPVAAAPSSIVNVRTRVRHW